ncbi:MAG: c-type cytochrome [Bacteroidota bacterium]
MHSIETARPLSEANLDEPVTHMPVSYEQRQGRYLYMKYCAVCHGEQGEGDGFNSFNLDPKPRDFTDADYMNALSDARLAETISQGGRGVSRSVLMPSWGGRLSKEEIEFLVSYLRLFGKSSYNEEE